MEPLPLASDDQVRGLAAEILSREQYARWRPLGKLDVWHLIQQWLDRYRSGAFVTRSLTLDEVEVRVYGPAAIAVGRESQQAAYQGHPADGYDNRR